MQPARRICTAEQHTYWYDEICINKLLKLHCLLHYVHLKSDQMINLYTFKLKNSLLVKIMF